MMSLVTGADNRRSKHMCTLIVCRNQGNCKPTNYKFVIFHVSLFLYQIMTSLVTEAFRKLDHRVHSSGAIQANYKLVVFMCGRISFSLFYAQAFRSF
jgi:hypothetical protein